ncbi:MAG TPA: hypothetical protein DCO72_07525 [Ruminococcus sp.]|nr:hypothetical protein [Ruminococcus sp.]
MNEQKDVFGKFDDILYEPIHAIVAYVEEPIKQLESWRKTREATADERVEARIEKEKQKMEVWTEEARAKLEMKRQKWAVQIADLEADHAMKRQKKFVEALEKYQVDLAKATRDIVTSMGEMSIEMRERANLLLKEMTEGYTALQDRAAQKSMEQLREARETYGDDPETFHMLRDEIMYERRTAYDLAGRFIDALADDLKQVNQNADYLLKDGMQTTKIYLAEMAGKMNVQLPTEDDTPIAIEKKDFIETKIDEET